MYITALFCMFALSHWMSCFWRIIPLLASWTQSFSLSKDTLNQPFSSSAMHFNVATDWSSFCTAVWISSGVTRLSIDLVLNLTVLGLLSWPMIQNGRLPGLSQIRNSEAPGLSTTNIVQTALKIWCMSPTLLGETSVTFTRCQKRLIKRNFTKINRSDVEALDA